MKIIDQRLLPHELKIVNLTTLSDSVYAIKEMQVRGAPLIGVTAAYGMYLASKESSDIDFLIQSGEKLKATRPTAVNLIWSVNKVINKIKENENNNRTEYILQIANNIRQDDIEVCSKIGDNGLQLLERIYKNKNSTINIFNSLQCRRFSYCRPWDCSGSYKISC